MTSEEFKAFLKKQRQDVQKNDAIDWEKRKERWLSYASQFVQEVQQHLSEFSEDLEVNKATAFITEDHLGEYSVPKLLISLPNKELIELQPVGTLLVGAWGRFDLKGLAGTVKFVLVPEDAIKPTVHVSINEEGKRDQLVSDNLVWRVATPAPNIRYLAFDKEALLQAIMEVSHG